jgi:cytochrome c peroxidase
MIKLNQWFRAAQGTNLPAGLPMMLLLTVFSSNSLKAQDQQAAPASVESTRAAQSIAKTMDPNSWAMMMTMSMDPRIWANPISSCAACHDNEDVGRYQQFFGPYVSAMMNPMTMANPQAYNDMMASMQDPKAAEYWQRAVEEKYGLNPGDPLPGMHSWPWGMVPGTPMPLPIPAQ